MSSPRAIRDELISFGEQLEEIKNKYKFGEFDEKKAHSESLKLIKQISTNVIAFTQQLIDANKREMETIVGANKGNSPKIKDLSSPLLKENTELTKLRADAQKFISFYKTDMANIKENIINKYDLTAHTPDKPKSPRH